jgi:hypothetical protein
MTIPKSELAPHYRSQPAWITGGFTQEHSG